MESGRLPAAVREAGQGISRVVAHRPSVRRVGSRAMAMPISTSSPSMARCCSAQGSVAVVLGMVACSFIKQIFTYCNQKVNPQAQRRGQTLAHTALDKNCSMTSQCLRQTDPERSPHRGSSPNRDRIVRQSLSVLYSGRRTPGVRRTAVERDLGRVPSDRGAPAANATSSRRILARPLPRRTSGPDASCSASTARDLGAVARHGVQRRFQ